MSANSFGRKFVITIFGESHGPGIGVVIDGIPAGLEIREATIQNELNRRRPGQSDISTSRDEKDLVKILAGITNGKTNGSSIAMFIENTDVKSKDYSLFRKIPRPSQIDYPAVLRYGQDVDLRGSGKFSGRLTATIVMAGCVAKAILSKYDIKIGAYVSQIGSIIDDTEYSVKQIQDAVEQNIVRTIKPQLAEKMVELIRQVKSEKDSIGGTISVRVENFPAGIGDPFFHALESDLAAGIMSIPAIRGIEFGKGFSAATMRGSEHNDAFIMKDGKISTKTNHCGGIIGGISIGTPIIFRVPIKPTASIGKTQNTLNFENAQQESLEIEGRHDPCIVPRVVVVLEAITAIVLADHLLISKSYQI